MDYVLLTVVMFLIVFGLLMIYSTSSYESGDLYLKKQAQSTVIGILGLIFMIKLPYKYLQKFDFLAVVVSAVLLLLVLTPLGMERNHAKRWIDLKFISFQPAEVAKIGVIVYLASIIQKLESVGKNIIRTPKGIAIVMVPPTIIAALIYVITKNLSSAIIVMGIAVAMLFVAVPDYKWFVAAGGGVLAVAAAVVMYVANADAATASFRQALFALGSGGIWGKGLGQSMQKMGFLPEAQNDMIFSIICEELGLFGAMAIILLFIILIWSCMVIANKTVDRFGSLLVVGVMAHYAIQVILNIAVVTNTIPNTGITLPFISYGGTATLFLLAEIGIVLNVSKSCK